MPRLARWIPLLLFALLALGALWALMRPRDDVVASAMVGQPLPAIALRPAIDGKPGISAATFAPGRPRLLNVFASWCIPCRAEAPQLEALRRAGVVIVGVALKDEPGDLAAFLGRYGDPFTAIGADDSGAVQLALGSSGVPETYVIGADGRIVSQHIGDIRPEHLPALLTALEQAR